MDETTRLLKRAASEVPLPAMTIDDVRRRRERAHRRRRAGGAVVGIGVAMALLALAATAFGPLAGERSVDVPRGGAGLPPRAETPVAIGPNTYSYEHLRYSASCPGTPDENTTVGVVDGLAVCPDTMLDLESWWKADGSGRIEKDASRNDAFSDGTFGPGKFPTEGDLSAFPMDVHQLRVFLLERSAPDGASPRPDVTPSPGVDLGDGVLWNAIRDYLGSTQYLNTTPALRSTMLEVLATVPMVTVDGTATDPVGRDAIALRFVAYAEDVVVYVDPGSHDFLAMTTRSLDTGMVGQVIVLAAGATSTTDTVPTGADRSIPDAS